MSSDHIFSEFEESGEQSMYTEQQIDLIWAMGVASLESNNGELVLPKSMESCLTKAQINDLKLRLSQYLMAPTIAFLDQEAQVYRVMKVPALKSGDSSYANSPSNSGSSPNSTAHTKESSPPYKPIGHARKSKVPRPPNAFILYRKERHPILKAENPNYHNNDISVILGKKWKSESDEVKARYKQLADNIKTKHMLDHPDYQYAPRKPSEKKRRMTARKAAELARADRMLSPEYQSDDVASDASGPVMADAADFLGVRRPDHLNHAHRHSDGNIDVTLPASSGQSLQNMTDTHNAVSTGQSFVPQRQYQVITTTPAHVQNAQAFADSLIDWEGIANDYALVTGASPEEMAQLDGVELGNELISLSEEDQRLHFQAELERTMRFF